MTAKQAVRAALDDLAASITHPATAEPTPEALASDSERGPDVPAGHDLMTVAEVSAALRVSKMTIYRLIEAGEIPAYRVGRSFRVPEAGYRAYLTQRT